MQSAELVLSGAERGVREIDNVVLVLHSWQWKI